MKRLGRIVCLGMLVTAATVWGQRADRTMITGVVADPAGSAVPNATVKIINTDTGVETTVITNESGAYSSPSLVLGTYTVSVEMAGFKTTARTGIRPAGGQTFRQEYYKGHAEDRLKILNLDARVTTPYVSTSHAVRT